jgi:hypothetical protein
MADYEELRQRHLVRMMELMPELTAHLTWPADRLRRERETALRTLVAHAQAHSPWHSRRLAGVDSDRLREADLRTLPAMTKDDLMDHFDEIVTDPRLTRDVVEAQLAALTTDAYLFDAYHVCASAGPAAAAARSSTMSTRGRFASSATSASSSGCCSSCSPVRSCRSWRWSQPTRPRT